VALGIAAIVSWFWFDYYYRDAFVEGHIKRRFGLVTAIQIGLLVASFVVLGIISLLV
jgi:hypothetical protein